MSLKAKIVKKFHGFNLNVEFETDGSCMGILGASGCGKSMTLKCVAGIEKPDSGRIVHNGRVLYDSDKGINLPARERHVGYLFQNYALFPTMTVEENLKISLTGREKEKQIQVLEQIERFQLNGLEKRLPSQLSGGQQQRLCIARVLALEPEVILLDRPCSALDPISTAKIEESLVQLKEQYTIVIAPHTVQQAGRIADRVGFMLMGDLIEQGYTQEVFSFPKDKRTNDYLTGRFG